MTIFAYDATLGGFMGDNGVLIKWNQKSERFENEDGSISFVWDNNDKGFVMDGGLAPVAFNISNFVIDKAINETGTTLNDITFTWSYANGTPTLQSINPTIGNVDNGLRTVTLSGQSITADTTFILSATDGTVNRTATASARFYPPIFYGTVNNNLYPTETDITAMAKRVSPFVQFAVSLNIADAHSCFASPMSNPITAIKETVFGLDITNTYTVINNVMITMANGADIIPYKVYVKSTLEHTMGMNLNLNILF